MSIASRLRITFGFLATTSLTILAAVTATFVLMRISGNPLINSLGDRLSEDELQRRLEAAGMNRPIIEQYFDYIFGLFRLDLGQAAVSQTPVLDFIVVAMPATLELAILGGCTGTLIALTALWLALRFHDGWLDRLSRVGAISIFALPSFLVAAFGKLVFSTWLGWLPSSGRYSISTELVLRRLDSQTGFVILDLIAAGRPELIADYLWHSVLPALTVGVVFAAGLFRGLRPHLVTQLDSDCVRGAKARGLSESRVLFTAALRPVAATAVSIWSFLTAWLLGGAVLGEIVFEWGGVGATLAQQVSNRDFMVVQGLVITIATVVILNYRFADLLARMFDPRLRERVMS